MSLGSEDEVNPFTIDQLKPPHEIKIQWKLLVRRRKTSFSFRKVEDVRDGYVEFLSDPRQNLEYDTRTRIDRAAQISPIQNTKLIQTYWNSSTNMSTQCNLRDIFSKFEEISKIEENKVMSSLL